MSRKGRPVAWRRNVIKLRTRPLRPSEVEDGSRIALAMGHEDHGGCACGRALDADGRCISAVSAFPCKWAAPS